LFIEAKASKPQVAPTQAIPPRDYIPPAPVSHSILPINPRTLHLGSLRASLEKKPINITPSITIDAIVQESGTTKSVYAFYSELYRKKPIPVVRSEADQDKLYDQEVEREFIQNADQLERHVSDRFGALASLMVIQDDVKAGIKQNQKEMKKW